VLDVNTDTDYRTLLGFLLANKGKAGEFLYLDPADFQVGPALVDAEPNLNCELQLLEGPEDVFYSPIQRNMGGTNINGFEDITDLVPDTLAVYGNGELIVGPYTIVGPGITLGGQSFEGLAIEWDPTPTGPITAQFQFYFRAAFEKDDDLEMDWFTGAPNRFSAKSVKLKSVRAASQV
jgi:hypothetical protein